MFEGDRVAVIGAGLAGSLVARALSDRGASPVVFDKSRGTGGRIAATRLGELSADLGGSILEEEVYARLVEHLEPLPLSLWPCQRADLQLQSCVEAQAWVPAPRASALTRALLEGIPFHAETRIAELNLTGTGQWWLKQEQGERIGPYDGVVVAVPAPQAVPLLESAPILQRAAASVRMSPAWVLLLELPQRPRALAEIDLLEGEHPVLERICRDSSKPGRTGEVWQLVANTEWSGLHQNENPDWIAEQLLDAFAGIVAEPMNPVNRRVHRWLYANVASTPGVAEPLTQEKLAVCGDWTCGQGLSAAVQSVELLIRALESGD